MFLFKPINLQDANLLSAEQVKGSECQSFIMKVKEAGLPEPETIMNLLFISLFAIAITPKGKVFLQKHQQDDLEWIIEVITGQVYFLTSTT